MALGSPRFTNPEVRVLVPLGTFLPGFHVASRMYAEGYCSGRVVELDASQSQPSLTDMESQQESQPPESPPEAVHDAPAEPLALDGMQARIRTIAPGYKWVESEWKGKERRPPMAMLVEEIKRRSSTARPAQWNYRKCIDFLLTNAPPVLEPAADVEEVAGDDNDSGQQRWSARRSAVRMFHTFLELKTQFLTRDKCLWSNKCFFLHTQ